MLEGMMDRQGNPLTLEGYLLLLEDDPNYHIVKQTFIHGLKISTVWLGYAMFSRDSLFETMIFGGPDFLNQTQAKHGNEDEAREFHQNCVEVFSNPAVLLTFAKADPDGRRRHGYIRHYRGLLRHQRKL